VPSRTVYLDGPASLANLETEDPAHYATVKRILASADVLCAPGPLTLQHAGNGPVCEGMLLKTSNPPKRQISFTLDDTRYIALVVLTQDQPWLMPAIQGPAGEPRSTSRLDRPCVSGSEVNSPPC
jgi:hypothetical protein